MNYNEFSKLRLKAYNKIQEAAIMNMKKYKEISDLFTYVTEVSEQGNGTNEIKEGTIDKDDVDIHLDMLCHLKFGKSIDKVISYYDLYEENDERMLDLSVFTDYAKNYKEEKNSEQYK